MYSKQKDIKNNRMQMSNVPPCIKQPLVLSSYCKAHAKNIFGHKVQFM